MRGSIVSAVNYTSYYKRRTQSNKINCAELHLLCMLTEMTHLLSVTQCWSASLSQLASRVLDREQNPRSFEIMKKKKITGACEELSNPKTGIAMIKLGTLPNFKVDFLILPLTWVIFNFPFFFSFPFLVSSHLFEYGCCQNPVFWLLFFFVHLQLWTSDSQGEDGEESNN